MYKLLAPAAVLVLLVGVAFDSSSRQYVPEGADEYHQRVAEAVGRIPYRVGDWVGVDKEIRQEALQILDANVSLSRTYRNVETGAAATLLLVHCADARSLLGHYPPVCYPSQGWTQVSATPQPIALEETAVVSTEYEFTHETLGHSARLGVAHFTVLPDGRTAPDMELLDSTARDKRVKFYGGASIQFIVDADVPEASRQDLYQTLLKAAQPWIEAVQSGLQS